MCMGCDKFLSKSFKPRHQPNCTGKGINTFVPVAAIAKTPSNFNDFEDGYKAILNTLHQDAVGDYIKTDQIILMVGARSYSSIKRKLDKVQENKRTVRSRIRLMARVYLAFLECYNSQTSIIITDKADNASDMYRRESIPLLVKAVENLTEKDEEELQPGDVVNQKSGLKLSILNMIKLTAKYLIGHYLIENCDLRSQYVVMFLKVLQSFENDLFGDAYYAVAHQRNTVLRKPVQLPKEEDVQLLLQECDLIMEKVDPYNLKVTDASYCQLRSAVVTCLIVFNARRGGEPGRLSINQWNEALKGEWVDREENQEIGEFDQDTMLITYQTGKGNNHLVPVIFPSETHRPIKYLANADVRRDASVATSNSFLFPATQNKEGHASGWHSINDILVKLSLKGALNPTKNRHRVASIL
ncbi:uncharacterized protein, partial [Clytia hemisphaerica]|uniref:uncharacterized protein n=1 Tax=Clytia hemisphaerica TaxID=252671 RepID=UPI0034D5766A